jgi:hypothetical protein
MKTLVVAGLVFVAVLVFIYHSFKPRPLPSIPHHTRLPWFSGDISYIASVARKTGRFSRALEMMAEQFGPISQVSFGSLIFANRRSTGRVGRLRGRDFLDQ